MWVRGRYYQKTIRVNGKMTCRYFGIGLASASMALLDEEARKEREQAQALDDEHRRLYEAERSRGETTRRLVATCLEASGFVRYQRNPWRRRSMKALPDDTVKPAPPARRDVQALIKRVRNDEPGALGQFRELAKVHPEIVIEETNADCVKLALGVLAHHECPSDRAMREGLLTKARLLFADLVEEDAGPPLRLVAEAVVFCWAEYWLLSSYNAHVGIQQTTPVQLKRQQAAHRRLMSSLRTYAQIARLENRPANIFDMFGK